MVKISPSNAMFLVTDPAGKVIASLSGSGPMAFEKQLDVVRQAAPRFPEQSSGFYSRNGDLYHVSVTPCISIRRAARRCSTCWSPASRWTRWWRRN